MVICAIRIGILAIEGPFDTGLTVMLDAFGPANKFSADYLKAEFSTQEAASALATSARTVQRRCEAGARHRGRGRLRRRSDIANAVASTPGNAECANAAPT
jgi:hypothetical protein